MKTQKFSQINYYI